jgi:hypothetical protein
MKQRAREFGGELRLRNADPGTLLELVIPANSVLRDLRWLFSRLESCHYRANVTSSRVG